MQNKTFKALTILILLLPTCAGASLATVNINVSAFITQLGVTPFGEATKIYSSYNFHGFEFALGQQVVGEATYSQGSFTSDYNGTTDNLLIYTSALQSIKLTVAEAQFSTSNLGYVPSYIIVSNNNHNTDGLWLDSAGPKFTNTRIYYEDSTGTAFTNFDLPIPFNPSKFTYGFAEFSYVDQASNDRVFVSALISNTVSITTAIPEPSTYILLTSGLCLLIVFRSKQPKNMLKITHIPN